MGFRMSSDSNGRPSFVVVMGDADRDRLDALKDHRGSLQPLILEAHGVDESVARILGARADLAAVPEDPQGQSHLEICRRVKHLNPRTATVVMREALSEVPPQDPAVDDYVALRNGDEMMARINVLLALRAYNARAVPIREEILQAIRAFDLDPGLLDEGRLRPPARLDCRALLDLDFLRDHEAALAKFADTSFACYPYAPDAPPLFSSGGDGCLRGVCPVAQTLTGQARLTVAVPECRIAAWRCARDAMVNATPQLALCPGGYRLAAFPVLLRFRTVSYPLLATCLALPSDVDSGQLTRLAERMGMDPARLRVEVARRPLPRLARLHLEALMRIEENMAEVISRQVSHEYATAFNVLVQAVERWENDHALTRRSHQLKHANERLRELNRHKGEFLANISHELKTPMTSIIGFSSLLLRGGAGALSEKGEHFLSRVLANARTLHAAIDDILSIAQLGGADVAPQPTVFDLGPLLQECIDEIRPSVARKPIELRLGLPPTVPACHTDRQRLRQILRHLLDNAAKFTHHGSIALSATVLEGNGYPRVAVAVTDTGIGLPTNALPHLFEEFRQVDGSTTRQHGGAGLGLSLVSKLTHLLGGEVTLESEPERGSTFTVTIPLDLPRFQQWRQAIRERVRADEPDPADRSSPILLAVDEDPQAILDLRATCAPHGYRVASAFSPAEAFERACTVGPFAIVADVPAPSHAVWEMADQLRGDPHTTDVPLIVVSATAGHDLADALGASDWLPRPPDADALLNALDRLRTGEAGAALVIVPDAARRHALRRALRDASYQVTACAGCRQAARFAGSRFDVILLDPEAEGEGALSALGCLHASPWAHTPVVACAAPSLGPEERDRLAPQVTAILDGNEADAVEAVARVLLEARKRPSSP